MAGFKDFVGNVGQMGADPTGKVWRLFGVYDESTGLDLRGTFIIDPEGKLLDMEMNFYNLGRNIDEMMRSTRHSTRSHPPVAVPAPSCASGQATGALGRRKLLAWRYDGRPAAMIRIGTSGYNYPEWRGSFYPEKFPTGKMLPYYAERFSTVEINYTFYRMPNAKTIAGWDAETPAGFSFTLKAPQRITHIARLREIGDPLRYFLDTAAGLGSKLGPLLFQLPPNFKKDLGRLGGLLDQLPAGRRHAFEFRHESWFADDVYERLRGANAALCIADTEEATTPMEVTADWGYLRLRDQGYTAADLEEWSRTIQRLGGRWSDAFVYFKHEEAGTGPAFARQLQSVLNP